MTTVTLLANGVIQTSLVLAGALLMTLMLRRRSAALRQAAVAAGIVCACATPLVRAFMPAWDIAPVSGVIVLESSPPVPVANLANASPAPQTTSGWAMADVLLAVWAAGAFLSLLVLGTGLFRLRQLRTKGTVLAPEDWRAIVHPETAAIGRRRHVRVVVTQHPTFAATWGVLRPTIAIPSTAREWTPERLRLVLAHEFAHVGRRDWLIHMTATILQSVYWFNPLTWIVSRHLRRLSEQACDDAVLALGVDETVYADHLIDLARVMGTHRRNWRFMPAEAMARRSSLEERVKAMLDTTLNRKPLGKAAWGVIIVMLAALAAPAAAVGLISQEGAGSLSGTLRDPQGRVIPNAAVTLSQAGNATVHKAQTDAAGVFTFPGLQGGDYRFEPGIPGFAARYPVTVRAGQQSKADVTLLLGRLTEEVTVSSRKGMPPPPPPAPGTPSPVVQPPYDPAADPCRRPGASACVKPPRKLRNVHPVVPAGREGVTATIVIEGLVGTDGKMQQARVTQPADAELGKAALDAVNQWIFAPTRLNGEPVATSIVVTIHFNNR